MTRPSFDLRYEHEMRAIPRRATTPPQAFFEARSLVARLSGLKALMDGERRHLGAWIATPPNISLS